MNAKPEEFENALLTAYALGETTPEETAEIEEKIKNSPELKAEVEGIRQLAGLLRTEFTEELESHQEEGSSSTNGGESDKIVRPHFWSRTEVRAGLFALAAALVALIAVPNLIHQESLSHQPYAANGKAEKELADIDHLAESSAQFLDEFEMRELYRDEAVVAQQATADKPLAQSDGFSRTSGEDDRLGSTVANYGYISPSPNSSTLERQNERGSGELMAQTGPGAPAATDSFAVPVTGVLLESEPVAQDKRPKVRPASRDGATDFSTQPAPIQPASPDPARLYLMARESSVSGRGGAGTANESGRIHIGATATFGDEAEVQGGKPSPAPTGPATDGARSKVLIPVKRAEGESLSRLPSAPGAMPDSTVAPDGSVTFTDANGAKYLVTQKNDRDLQVSAGSGGYQTTTEYVLTPINAESKLAPQPVAAPGATTDSISITAGSTVELQTVTGTSSLAAIQVQSGAASATAAMPAAAAAAPEPASLSESDAYFGRQANITNGGERYTATYDNPYKSPAQEALSTFSVDVDTASYTRVRKMIENGQPPHRDQVRVEEFINYFDYGYSAPTLEDVEEENTAPFAVNLEVAPTPWNAATRLVRIGIQGAVPEGDRPAMNLVFLVDVSGSMKSQDKLPLVQKTLRDFVPHLREDDRVAMVVYAGSTGEVLPPTSGAKQNVILAAIDALSAGGSTAGAAGLELAYQRARENFSEEGINRVILATDGDFNVGQSSDEALVNQVEREAKSGVFLTVLGFGTGNLNDSMLEKITNKGNGNYYYIDRLQEGRRVLGTELTSTLVTIAKDVKIQVEFNPGRVRAYRLIGYANRMLNPEDFADDRKDAGEIGAGHTVTALYEVLPLSADLHTELTGVDLKYQRQVETDPAAEPKPQPRLQQGRELVESPELLTVNLRYKQPDGQTSSLITVPLADPEEKVSAASEDLRFAAAVAAYGMRLRASEYLPRHFDFSQIRWLAGNAIGEDPTGARTEFLELVQRTESLAGSHGYEEPYRNAPQDEAIRRAIEDGARRSETEAQKTHREVQEKLKNLR